MVKNSLMHAIQKSNAILEEIQKGKYEQQLATRLDFYGQEGRVGEYSETASSAQFLEEIIYGVSEAFFSPTSNDRIEWGNYYELANGLLYGEKPTNSRGLQNSKLLEKVAKSLQQKFPDEGWTFGELPVFRWKILFPFDFESEEYSAEEVAEFEANSNIRKCGSYYIEYSSVPALCLYQERIKADLEKHKEDIDVLSYLCSEIKKSGKAYVIDEQELGDECSGGFDNYLINKLNFTENATHTIYGLPLTVQEQVMNDTIVSEIDSRCANRPEIQTLHKNLDELSEKLAWLVSIAKLKPAESGKQTTEANSGLIAE